MIPLAPIVGELAPGAAALLLTGIGYLAYRGERKKIDQHVRDAAARKAAE